MISGSVDDRIRRLGYYREKLAIEGLNRRRASRTTILRTTAVPRTRSTGRCSTCVTAHLPGDPRSEVLAPAIATEDVANRRSSSPGPPRPAACATSAVPNDCRRSSLRCSGSVRHRCAEGSRRSHCPAAPSPATRPGTTSCPARPTARSRSPTTRPDDMEHPHDARAETRPRRARIHRTRTRALDVIRTRELLQRRADRRSHAAVQRAPVPRLRRSDPRVGHRAVRSGHLARDQMGDRRARRVPRLRGAATWCSTSATCTAPPMPKRRSSRSGSASWCCCLSP